MAPPSDTQINNTVRRVLVQHWVDLGALSIRTSRGVVTVSGTLKKLRDSKAAVGAGELDGIRLAIGRSAGVRRVQLDLANPGLCPATDTTREAEPQVVLARPWKAERSAEIT